MDTIGTENLIQRFPWNGKFMTKTEIDDYLAGNKIQCLLCGKWFKIISSHLKRIHDIDSDEYREKYGLPWKHGLCGKEVSLKLSTAMNERRKNGFLPDIDAAREKSKHATKRPDQPFFKKVKIENLECFNKDNRKYSEKDYQNVLRKMLKETKGLYETCKDDDMPDIRMVSKYAKRNKEFRKALERTYERLPYSVQAGAGRLPENKFKEDLKSLKRSNISVADMSRLLGVSKNLIRNRLNSIGKIPQTVTG